MEWKQLLGELRRKLADSPVDNRFKPDWTAWCKSARKDFFETIARYALKNGIAFMYGEDDWTEAHLRALEDHHNTMSTIVFKANPERIALEDILELITDQKNKHKIPHKCIVLSSFLAATAFAFAEEAKLQAVPGCVTHDALTHPAMFANQYFVQQQHYLENFPTRRPEQLCVEFFLHFLEQILSGQKDQPADPYVIIWPVDLINDFFTNRKAVRRRDGDEPLMNVDEFQKSFISGVRDYQYTGATRVGLIAKISQFPRDHFLKVAKKVLTPPPLSLSEIQQLVEYYASELGTELDSTRLAHYTGGLPKWIELLLSLYAWERSRRGNSAVPGTVLADCAHFLAGVLADPALATDQEVEPPSWLLPEISTLRQRIKAVPNCVPAVRLLYKGDGRNRVKWDDHVDTVCTRGLVALAGADDGDSLESFRPFYRFEEVLLERLPTLSDGLFRAVEPPQYSSGRDTDLGHSNS